MGALALALASTVLVLPREYHIDCLGWTGAAQADFDVCMTAMDGSVVKIGIVMAPKTTPDDVRYILESPLRRAGWHYRRVGNGILVLEGSKKAPIRSVEFKSKDWTPAVRVVLVVPRK
jgi:hypothetical protein